MNELAMEHRSASAMQSGPGHHLEATVLIVEDNPVMNRLMAETLAGICRTICAFDGDEGFKFALEHNPDLILSDVMMPKLSGDQLVQKIRSHAQFDGTPIILLTANVDEQLRLRLLQNGVQDYIIKPYSPAELRARAQNLLIIKRTREMLQRELVSQQQDISLLASQLAHRKHELEIALENAQIAREHAERASQVKSQFLALVSHELRTPLTTLQIQLRLLRRATSDSSHEGTVQKIERNANRLLEMIEALLEHTRVESGLLNLQFSSVDLIHFMNELLEELKPLAQAKQLNLSCTLPKTAVISTDGRVLRLILTNLLSNAIKYTEHGSVKIELQEENTAYHIKIIDTGIGIAPDKQIQIFEPFVQLEPVTHKHGSGVGLGLTLVREMVAALGGKLSLTSALGVGSTFSIELSRNSSFSPGQKKE